MNDVFRILVSLTPVLVFLVVLRFLDSFKLVPGRLLATAILAGSGAAFLSLFVNEFLLSTLTVSVTAYSRYFGPLIEEAMKAAYLLWLIKRGRVGFLVDATILGFAVGAGFAIIENLYYIQSLASNNPLLWIVRGFGTAVIHGGATAVFAVLGKGLLDRRPDSLVVPVLVSLLAAAIPHSLFNHFALPPVWNTIAVVIVLPLVFTVVFRYSEDVTRQWLGSGMDADLELLDSLASGEIADTPVGKYLTSIRSHFAGNVVADMFCYLQLYAELAIGAKGTLLLREAGIEPQRDAALEARLTELEFLQQSIGQTGRMALTPILKTSPRDLWQLYMLRR